MSERARALEQALRALAYDIGTVRDVAARRGDPDVDHRLMLMRLDHWRSVILSAIASLEAVDKVEPEPCVWRDIASAPKDETPIRLKWAGTTVEAIGRWCPAQVLPSGFGRSNYSDDWRDVEGDDVLLLPTHWKPVIVSGSPLKVER